MPKSITDIDMDAVLPSEAILPEQFFPSKPRSEEMDLLGESFKDAIKILTGAIACSRHQWEQDYAWLIDDSEDYSTFRWFCKVLELNHFAIRKGVLASLKEPVKRPKKRKGECFPACRQGHSMTPENCYFAPKTQKRHCKACKTVAKRRSRAVHPQ